MPVVGFQVVATVPGATNLTSTQLTDDMIVSISTADPHSAQTTLGQLKLYFGSISAGVLYNNGGALGVVDPTWPSTSSGAPGTVWSNGGEATVVAGYTPISGPPVFFGLISSAQLLALNAATLPVTSPTVGSLQLWVLNNVILVA